MATTTKKRAIELMNISPHHFSQYGHDTANKTQDETKLWLNENAELITTKWKLYGPN